MYAIIATGGKQYKVSEGDVLQVEKLNAAEGDAVTFDQVRRLLYTSTREKPVTTRRMVIDKHTLRLRSKRLTRNRYDNYYHS